MNKTYQVKPVAGSFDSLLPTTGATVSTHETYEDAVRAQLAIAARPGSMGALITIATK